VDDGIGHRSAEPRGPRERTCHGHECYEGHADEPEEEAEERVHGAGIPGPVVPLAGSRGGGERAPAPQHEHAPGVDEELLGSVVAVAAPRDDDGHLLFGMLVKPPWVIGGHHPLPCHVSAWYLLQVQWDMHLQLVLASSLVLSSSFATSHSRPIYNRNRLSGFS